MKRPYIKPYFMRTEPLTPEGLDKVLRELERWPRRWK